MISVPDQTNGSSSIPTFTATPLRAVHGRTDMPHFYFNVRARAEFLKDPDSFEVYNLGAAEHEAIQSAVCL